MSVPQMIARSTERWPSPTAAHKPLVWKLTKADRTAYSSRVVLNAETRFPVPKSDKETGGAQTVDRALVVLQIVATEARPVSLDEIASRAGLHKSVTYRLVRSLENAGFIGRDPSLGGYAIAATFLSLSVQAVSRIDLRRHARPAMEAIVALHGETASLHIRSGVQRVCVDSIEGGHAIRRVVPVGETLPLYAGETGRVLMSDLPAGDLAPLLAAASARGADAPRLKDDLLLVRKQGYFIGIGVRTPDVGSLSLPIFGPVGIVGALTISGPANRWNRAAMKAAVPSVLKIIAPVTTALGGGGLAARRRGRETPGYAERADS
jgi:DNA-binding IclR family transcriptional regulator